MNSAAISFRLGPVPVVIRPSVVVMLAFIGFLIDATSLTRVGVWTLVGLGSILIHEMGHAVFALGLGGKPNVQLMGLGGATDPGLAKRPGRLQSAGLSLAGPVAGLLTGMLIWAFAEPDLNALTRDEGLVAFAVATAVWMNIGWSLLNLVPVLPLDGGRLLTEALPGDPITRSRRAYLASAIFGGVVAVALLAIGEPFAGILFGFLASQSFTIWRTLHQRQGREVSVANLRELHGRLVAGDASAEPELRSLVDDPELGPVARTSLIDYLARSGRSDEAEQLTEKLSTATPTATFLIEVMQSGGEKGVDSLIEAFRRAPSPLAVDHLVLGLHSAGRDREIAGIVADAARRSPDNQLAEAAQLASHQVGAFGASAELGALVYQLDPSASGIAAFNVACSLARDGEVDAALGWLNAAVERGLPDPSMLDTDTDLATLRTRVEFGELRRRAFSI